jgi:hypothetical protein
MCVYMHVCICVYTHVCMCVYMHVCMCVYTHVCMCVYTHVCMCVYTHVCMYIICQDHALLISYNVWCVVCGAWSPICLYSYALREHILAREHMLASTLVYRASSSRP